MRVLTAKEVNFVSGGEIYTDHPTHLNAGSNSDVSWCPKPSENNDSKGGYLGTGMPCTSGNSIGDVNYLPPTQEGCHWQQSYKMWPHLLPWWVSPRWWKPSAAD